MNIVCGEFASISCGTWLGFWSGAIGAFVAAVIGGLVALVVVRLTNGQQRRLASHTREIAAIADMVAAIDAMGKKYRDGPDVIQDLVLVGEAASVRWEMESTHDGLIREIAGWPYHVGTFALVTAHEYKRSGDVSAPKALMFEAQKKIRYTAMAWPKASRIQRDALIANLVNFRLEQEREYEKLSASSEA